MGIRYNEASQIEDKQSNENLPLIANFMRENKELQESWLIVTRIKESSSGEWLIVTVCDKFTALINTESNQGKDFQETLKDALAGGYPIICRFHPKSKSRAVFGLDDECDVKWDANRDETEHWVTFYSPSVPYQLPSPIPVKKARKTSKVTQD